MGVWNIQGIQSLSSLEREFHTPAPNLSSKVSFGSSGSHRPLSSVLIGLMKRGNSLALLATSLPRVNSTSSEAAQGLPRTSPTAVVQTPTSSEPDYSARSSLKSTQQSNREFLLSLM